MRHVGQVSNLSGSFFNADQIEYSLVRPKTEGSNRLETRPASIGDVARRISSRTTDLVAISIVLVASLTLGRQVLHWWHAEPPPPASALTPEVAGPAWDDERKPVSLEFGDLTQSLTRQIVEGDQQAAIAALVRHCQAVALAAACPAAEPDAAERQLLERIAGLKPVDPLSENSTPAKMADWQVYVIDKRFTMVVAVKRFPDQRPESGQPRGIGASKETARGGMRLVCWGTAMPVGEAAWTLYLFRESPRGTSPSGPLDVPLPAGARRNLSLRDENGAALIGFSGRGSAKVWMKFYDDWCLHQGWSPTENKWSIGAQAWSASFRRQQDAAVHRVEIRLAADEQGELTGLIQMQSNE